MTKLEIQLKNRIMRRVYAIWFLKKLLGKSFLRTSMLIVFFAEFLNEVSIPAVLNNLPARTDILANYHYLLSAFSQTEISVQMYLVGILAIFSWLILDQALKAFPFIGIGSRL